MHSLFFDGIIFPCPSSSRGCSGAHRRAENNCCLRRKTTPAETAVISSYASDRLVHQAVKFRRDTVKLFLWNIQQLKVVVCGNVAVKIYII